ncbi:MAG: hypothetical protein KDB27_03110 [Planctomycetales bacterium]|nr:hypothetical protein [Planctomycetales bacterium]
MSTQRNPFEFVVHVAQLYHRGVICPTEAWNQIHDATDDHDAIALFNQLNENGQELIREIHLERPESLEGLATAATGSRFPAMLDWCLAGANPRVTFVEKPSENTKNSTDHRKK